MLVILSKKDLVIGHTLEAIKFAYDNDYSFVLNSKLKYHSYEEEEELASKMLWKMRMKTSTALMSGCRSKVLQRRGVCTTLRMVSQLN